MKTKSTIVLILLLLFALMLASCGDGGDEDADGDEGLSLIESGEPTFQIVIAKGSSADVRRTVDFDVVRALERDYGISVTSVTEGSSDDQICDIEVLVGSAASRGEQYCYDAHTLGEEGYIIKRIGTKVVIGGGSDESICRAISEFCTDILGMGSGALEEAVMYFSDSKEIVQSNYKITSLSVSGNDMRGYSIVTDTADASYRECAEAFSDTVYKKSGYYLPVTDKPTENGNVIIKKVPKRSGDESFRVYTSEGDLIVECAYDNMLTLALGRFAVDYITFGTGDVNFDGEVYKENISIIRYDDFGALGDGRTDDFEAILRAHELANISGQTVMATPGKTYYIKNTRVGGAVRTVPVKTDVVWTGAKFIIDDTEVSVHRADKGYGMGGAIFTVTSDYPKKTIYDSAVLLEIAEAGINRNTEYIELGDEFDYPALIIPYNSSHKVYRRRGYTSYAGSSMHEVILIDKNGRVSSDTPIMHDYTKLDYIEVYRTDLTPITVEGGEFTTLASRVNCITEKENGKRDTLSGYFNRGLNVSRSYTTVKDVKHYIEGEFTLDEQLDEDGNIVAVGACYRGFFVASNATDVTFEDCVLTGRRCYPRPQGGTGGTYDFSGAAVNNIVLKNCIQSNFWVNVTDNVISAADEKDVNALPSMASPPGVIAVRDSGSRGSFRMHWGIGGTNFCKNMVYDGCTLSRYDAHEGLYNGKIKDSTVNCISLTGNGLFEVENLRYFAEGTGYGQNVLFILRSDYGYTWEGDIVADGVEANVYTGDGVNIYILQHGYSNWYYGYNSVFPNIELKNLMLYDIKTEELLPRGTEIHLTKVAGGSKMHLLTSHTEAYYSVEDKDGDGFVDEPVFDINLDGVVDPPRDTDGNGEDKNTSISYTDIVESGEDYDSGVPSGTYVNFNRVRPPEYIKITDNPGGYVYVMPRTSGEGISDGDYYDRTESYGGFFGDTKFYYSEEEFFLGTAERSNETYFIFR